MKQNPEALVIDASVAVKWLVEGEVLGEQATHLWYRYLNEGMILVAPAHIHCEVPSAIISTTRGQSARLQPAQAKEAIEEFLNIAFRVVPTKELVLGAFDLTIEFEISIYDALYLALALEYELPLVTADARFARKLTSVQNVLWLGDLPAE